MSNHILVITNPDDPHADAVIPRIEARGVGVVRWHPTSVSVDCTVSLSNDGLVLGVQSSGRRLATASVRSVWLRKPRLKPPSAHDTSPGAFAQRENLAVLYGLWSRIQGRWTSPRLALLAASCKPRQLSIARTLGFQVPDYLISNCATDLIAFLDGHESVVLKAVHDDNTWIGEGDALRRLAVAKLSSAQLRSDLPGSGYLSFVQAFVNKVHDVRLIAIGRRYFAVSISDRDSIGLPVDWRARAFEYHHSEVAVPAEVGRAVGAYLDEFGLPFGAFDFAIDKDGVWWFLECNGNGQWLWLELLARVPISEAIAEHLCDS